MLLKINEIKNILGYTLCRKDLLLCNEQNEIYFQERLIERFIDGQSLKTIEDMVFFSSCNENRSFFFQKGKTKSINSAIWVNTVYKNTVVKYDYLINERLFVIELLDFNSETLLKKIGFKIDIWNQIRDNGFLYFFDSNKNNLSKLSLILSEINWQTDLSGRKYLDVWQEEKEAKIQRIIGVYQNQLIVAFSHEELISIDTETGKILWETKDFVKTNLSDWRNQSQFRFVYWHIENGKMYQLDGNVYYSIDLNTQAVEILWKDDREDDYLTIIHKTYTNDYIYFTGSYNHRLQPHLIGVFNRKTLSVEWVKDMNFSVDTKLGYPPSLNQAPQVDGDKLYVLDTAHTLHIFEKTEENEFPSVK